jgi:hypothetical protein
METAFKSKWGPAVDALACDYGWTEDEILSLPLERVSSYVDLLNERRKQSNRGVRE